MANHTCDLPASRVGPEIDYLVENQSLTDVTPAAGGRSVVEEEQQHHEEHDAGGGVDGVDDKHHDHAADDAQQAGVPGEELESRPAGRGSRR